VEIAAFAREGKRMAKILVVQNDSQTRRELSRILESNTHDVVAVSSTKLGIKTLEYDPAIAVVICDLLASDRSGLDLLQHIQTTPRLHWTPVLMTGRTFDSDIVQQCLDLGASDIILLPFDPKALKSKLDKALLEGRRTVLLVDDEVTVLEVLSDTFEIERFDVIRATSAEQALDLLEINNVHIVVSDIMLPRKSGFDLLRSLKEKDPNLPVILVTGLTMKNHSQDALDAGADAYFGKPFKNTELIYTVRRLLKTTALWQFRRRHVPVAR
jgi:CheY-like chemotaxis protein